MQKKINSLVGLLAGLSLVLGACRPASPSVLPTPSIDPNAVFTAAAETASAKMTEIAARTPTPEPATATATSQPPSPTVAATTAVVGTATATLAAGVGSSQGDNAQWVQDLTVPDGTTFASNETFTKKWKIQNTGSSTWTTSYNLVFTSGAPMTATTKVPLAASVGPGQTVDLSVDMTAPADPGSYKGFWRMANAQGTPFGVTIWVDIKVGGGSGTPTVTPTGATVTPGGATSTVTTTPGPTGSADSVVTGAQISANTSSYEGACPYTFLFPAQLTLSKAGTVTYQLEAGSDNASFQFTLPAPTTVSLQAGTHDITYQLEFSQSVSGWVRFHVTSPNDVTSTQVSFSLTCK